MESNLEVRVYTCGCIDNHDVALWAATCVEHCAQHTCREDGSFYQQDENPAACEGIPYTLA